MRRTLVLALVGFAFVGPSASGSPRQLRIAYITDVVTPANPHTLRGIAYVGFLKAVKDFGVQGRVVQYNPKQGERATLESLGRQRYDLIFAGIPQSDEDYQAVGAVAAQFPRSKFVLPFRLQGLKVRPKNLEGWIERNEQPAYLAGYLAALIEKRGPGRDVIGSVGGFPFTASDGFIAGYEAGARKADAGIETLHGFSRDWFDAAKCKAVALSQIARGAGVVFDVAGQCGLGVLRAAKQKRVWGVGVDVDQSFLGPHILTSVISRGDVEVYKTVEAFVKGKLKTGGSVVWDLRNGGVGLGEISPKVPRAYVRKVESIRKKIVAGKIKVPATLAKR